jgi:hypothetical protein
VNALEAVEAIKDAKAYLILMQVRLQGNPKLDDLAGKVQLALINLRRAIDLLGGDNARVPIH